MLTTTGTVAADVRSVRERARRRRMTGSPDRQIDISFVADRTLRREQLIAMASGMLWEWRTDLRFISPDGANDRSLADCRIALLVHGGDELGFDWARAGEAISDGCVIVCETSTGFEPLVPGVHFVMAPYENVVEQAVALAFDEPRRASMAEAARTLERPEPASLPPAVETPTRHRSRRRKSTSSSSQDEAMQKLVTELKVAILAQRELTRSIDSTISTIEHGDPDHVGVVSTSTWQAFEAEVSVVVPLFNEGRRLRDTVDSVIAASSAPGPSVELLIVDDHSTDDSIHVAQRLLADIDWFPATLLSRAASAGPAAARNTGFIAARAPHVLALDTGSTLYPTGLRRLHDRLHAATPEVVATYGLIELFDTGGSLGLAGHLEWSVELLLNGEFADTVAMFRRATWLDLGGYVTPPSGVEDGWADYDLWLSAAERLLRAEVVGSVIGRHREQLASMLNLSEIDTASTFITLRERHPRLPWPS
jgi:Glycosyl transferase family 2